jgi:general secretion pathway protein A
METRLVCHSDGAVSDMYTSFYGLHERPFDLTPNPRFLYLSAKHREALSNLQYGITGRKGITLLVGDVGTGKTTVLRSALASLDTANTLCVSVSNPTLTRSEFYEFLAAGFGLSERAAQSKARFLLDLYALLGQRQKAGHTTALVIDEAQSLPFELMEEVRLLANLQTTSEQLFPVALIGQPQLGEIIEQPELRQLKQRVALRCDLGPLDLVETAAYVSGRIRIAGGEARNIFTKDAITSIYDVSGGVPRTISVVCDNALVSGFAADVKPIGADIVMEVGQDFSLGQERSEGAARQNVTRLPDRGAARKAGLERTNAKPAVKEKEKEKDLFSQIFRRRRVSLFGL